MRVVPREEFRYLLAYALRRLPARSRPKDCDLAAFIITGKPPLDRLEISIGEGMKFGDMQPGKKPGE